MSGGSFNYLYQRELTDFTQNSEHAEREARGDLLSMAYFLEHLGSMRAALETHAVWVATELASTTEVEPATRHGQDLRLTPEVEQFLTRTLSDLNPLWRAVEWMVSGDSGIHCVQAAQASYLRSRSQHMQSLTLTPSLRLLVPALSQTPADIAEDMQERFSDTESDQDQFLDFDTQMSKAVLSAQFEDIAAIVRENDAPAAAAFLRELATDVANAIDQPHAAAWFHGWANRLGQGVWGPVSGGLIDPEPLPNASVDLGWAGLRVLNPHTVWGAISAP